MLAAPQAPPTTPSLKQLKAQGFARVAIANEPPFTARSAADGKGAPVRHPTSPERSSKRLGVKGSRRLDLGIRRHDPRATSRPAASDAVTAGLFMKPERCAAVAYSEPVLCDAGGHARQEGQSEGLQELLPISPRTDRPRIGAPGGGTEEKLALEAGVPRERVIVVPDGQSGLKMLQDGRIDAYSLPVLSINDLVKKANDPNLEVVAPASGRPGLLRRRGLQEGRRGAARRLRRRTARS